MKKKATHDQKHWSLGSKAAAILLFLGVLYGGYHYYTPDSKPQILSEYDIRNAYDSAVRSIYYDVSSIKATCANPYATGASMVGLSPRDSLLSDADSAAFKIQNIPILSQQFEKFDPKLNAELNQSFKQSQDLVQSVLSTQKCPKDPSSFEFLKSFGKQAVKVFPCAGIC